MKELITSFSKVCTALALVVASTTMLSSQEVRSLDGTGNNLTYPEWGAAGTQVLKLTSQGFADSIASPAGENRPNPRSISNAIFSQSGEINDQLTLSDFVWVFGQFIDHDIVLSDVNMQEPILIEVPIGDPDMDPGSTGQAVIPMFRNLFDPATGTGVGNPRVHINSNTSFIDASAVYGADFARASWLRIFVDGKLRTSQGNLLPFNTLSGEFNDPTDHQAPEMADDLQSGDKLFVAGDVRANENPLLISFHTLFVREHNRQCDLLKETHPEWDDERLYQKARRIVTGLLQSVVYNEWLPAMGIDLDEYTGYQADVDPRISNEFATAAFRLGHTLLSSEIIRLDNDGNVIPQGNIGLKEAFFNAKEVLFAGGIDVYFKGMGTQIQQNLDCKIIEDVRNFLFGEPGQGGLDLAAINIMRGRERGLKDFNALRVELGFEAYANFEEVCGNPELTGGLQDMYGSIDNVDPWVGMLAEDHMPNAICGETIMMLMKEQFTRLRDGDRFFYMNDPGLSLDEMDEISQTRLSDIIRRNTDVELMQENVFFAKDHDEIPFAKASITRSNLDVTVFPNPVRYEAHIKSYAQNAGDGAIRIFDREGKLIMTQDVTFQQGVNTLSIDVRSILIPGAYVLQLEQNGVYNAIRFVRI